jgi:hypothetical protein
MNRFHKKIVAFVTANPNCTRYAAAAAGTPKGQTPSANYYKVEKLVKAGTIKTRTRKGEVTLVTV